MEGMGLKLTIVVVRHLLDCVGMFVWLVLLGLIARPGLIMMTLQIIDIAYMSLMLAYTGLIYTDALQTD